MRHHRGMVVSIGFVCAVSTAGLVPAQEDKATTPLGRDRRSDDMVWAAARREVEARKRETEAMFARLRALPQPLLEPRDIQLGMPPGDIVLTERDFDMLVFGGGNAEAWRADFDAFLSRQIEEADREWGLTPAQEEKLRLAGRGDMKRLFDRVEEKRREVVLVPTPREKFAVTIDDLRKLRIAIRPLPFGRTAIYSKTLNKITNGQRAAR